MDKVTKKLDDFTVLLDTYLENVPEEDICYVATCLCNNIVISSTRNHLEAMGFIECLKIDFQKQLDEMCADEAKAKNKKPVTVV